MKDSDFIKWVKTHEESPEKADYRDPEAKNFQLIRDSLDAIGELRLKEEMDKMHQNYQRNKARRSRLQWISGIAASIVIVTVSWISLKDTTTSNTPLEMHHAPNFMDSAQYAPEDPDSVKHRVDEEQ